jgi:hypothetical protein
MKGTAKNRVRGGLRLPRTLFFGILPLQLHISAMEWIIVIESLPEPYSIETVILKIIRVKA